MRRRGRKRNIRRRRRTWEFLVRFAQQTSSQTHLVSPPSMYLRQVLSLLRQRHITLELLKQKTKEGVKGRVRSGRREVDQQRGHTHRPAGVARHAGGQDGVASVCAHAAICRRNRVSVSR